MKIYGVFAYFLSILLCWLFIFNSQHSQQLTFLLCLQSFLRHLCAVGYVGYANADCSCSTPYCISHIMKCIFCNHLSFINSQHSQQLHFPLWHRIKTTRQQPANQTANNANNFDQLRVNT